VPWLRDNPARERRLKPAATEKNIWLNVIWHK
jgi:hypothetical protein